MNRCLFSLLCAILFQILTLVMLLYPKSYFLMTNFAKSFLNFKTNGIGCLFVGHSPHKSRFGKIYCNKCLKPLKDKCE